MDAEAIQSTFLGPDDLVALAALPVDEQERHDTSSLDLVLTGDGPLSPAAFTAAEDLLGLDVARDVYATAETGPVAVDGIPLAGVDVEQRGGTLWVRSPLLADGYHDHPDATAAAFRDGLFDTGYRAAWTRTARRGASYLIRTGVPTGPARAPDVSHAHADAAVRARACRSTSSPRSRGCRRRCRSRASAP